MYVTVMYVTVIVNNTFLYNNLHVHNVDGQNCHTEEEGIIMYIYRLPNISLELYCTLQYFSYIIICVVF
jgi:hypothetical protein